MPLSNYDRYHGGSRGSAKKTLSALIAEYGPEKGKRVFYGLTEKRKRQGKGKGLSRKIRSAS